MQSTSGHLPDKSEQLKSLETLLADRASVDPLEQVIRSFGYAVLNSAGFAFLERIAPSQGFISIGSGKAFLEAQLANQGVAVVASDVNPPADAFLAVLKADHQVVSGYADRALLLSYPNRNAPYGTEAVRLYARNGGQAIVFLGDAEGFPLGTTSCFYRELEYLRSQGWESVSFNEGYPTSLQSVPGVRRKPQLIVTSSNQEILTAAASARSELRALLLDSLSVGSEP